MNREQLRQLALAGTVTFPATFPRLAELRLESLQGLPIGPPGGPVSTMMLLVATERPSAKVTITRKLAVAQVAAIFLPHNVHNVRSDDGYWFLQGEVAEGLSALLNQSSSLHGIVYVAEHCSTLLEVQAGMTAAESAQYYPPLPCDRSHNHYNPSAGGSMGPGQGVPGQGVPGQGVPGQGVPGQGVPLQGIPPQSAPYFPCEPMVEASYFAPCERMSEAECRVQSSGPYWPLPCETMEYFVPQAFPSDHSPDEPPE